MELAKNWLNQLRVDHFNVMANVLILIWSWWKSMRAGIQLVSWIWSPVECLNGGNSNFSSIAAWISGLNGKVRCRKYMHCNSFLVACGGVTDELACGGVGGMMFGAPLMAFWTLVGGLQEAAMPGRLKQVRGFLQAPPYNWGFHTLESNATAQGFGNLVLYNACWAAI